MRVEIVVGSRVRHSNQNPGGNEKRMGPFRSPMATPSSAKKQSSLGGFVDKLSASTSAVRGDISA